jgi:hypothetical protein
VIIATPETGNEKEPGDLRALQRIGQLARPIGRVYVDQNGADLRRGHLHDQPFDVVRRPDADTLALGEAEPEQAASQAPDLISQCSVCQPAPLRS